MVCVSLNQWYLCSGLSLLPELKQSEDYGELLQTAVAAGALESPIKTETSQVAVPVPCNLRQSIHSCLMRLQHSFAIAFRGFFCTETFCKNIAQILCLNQTVLRTPMNSTSPKSDLALHVVSECNVRWFCSVCRSSMWCGSGDAQWINRSWSFQKQQVFTQHTTIHVSVGLHVVSVSACESQCRRVFGKFTTGCCKADSFHSFYTETN